MKITILILYFILTFNKIHISNLKRNRKLFFKAIGKFVSNVFKGDDEDEEPREIKETYSEKTLFAIKKKKYLYSINKYSTIITEKLELINKMLREDGGEIKMMVDKIAILKNRKNKLNEFLS